MFIKTNYHMEIHAVGFEAELTHPNLQKPKTLQSVSRTVPHS